MNAIKLDFDFSKLSIMQRHKIREMIWKFAYEDSSGIKEDIRDWPEGTVKEEMKAWSAAILELNSEIYKKFK